MFQMMFERVYYQDRRPMEPPPELREAAERQIPFLLADRTHVLTTYNGSVFSRLPLSSSDGWIVTYMPTEPT